jgi:hypothetical protein
MKKTYNITINVTVDVKSSEDGKRIPWISFKGWKHGVVTEENMFIETDPIVKKTSENMKYIGEHIFEAAKQMFYEDEDLQVKQE